MDVGCASRKSGHQQGIKRHKKATFLPKAGRPVAFVSLGNRIICAPFPAGATHSHNFYDVCAAQRSIHTFPALGKHPTAALGINLIKLRGSSWTLAGKVSHLQGRLPSFCSLGAHPLPDNPRWMRRHPLSFDSC